MPKVKTIKAWAATGPKAGSIAHQWRFDGRAVNWKVPAEMTIYRTRAQARQHKPVPSKLVRVEIRQIPR